MGCPISYVSSGQNFLFAENAITKCWESSIGFAGLGYELWGISFEGPLSAMKVP